MENVRPIDRENLKPLPVGKSEWADFAQTNYTVDKTLLIKELIDDDTGVALFTRPRRFGKTTALKMIKAFFEKTPEDTSFLFAGRKIWAAGEKYRAEQGKYPVIYLTFKDIDGETWESALANLRQVVAAAVAVHREAVGALDAPTARETLVRVMNARGSVEDMGASLGLLAEAAHRHDPDGRKAVVLIDEYDAPVNRASSKGYLKEMTAFMRAFLSGAMKDNEHVRMGIMTGVLRVAKEGILSGLNNPRVWTVFDGRYNGYFGFTEEEVAGMARYYGVPEKMDEIRSWYDGYDFGGAEIYNPWSVLNYFDRHCRPGAYWLDTSSNDIIADVVRSLPHDMAGTLTGLLGEKASAVVKMTQELGPYAQVKERKDTLYALLVSSGYLKCCSPIEDGYCRVAIPNRELSTVFVGDIVSKLSNAMKTGPDDIARALVCRDPGAFRDAVARFLVESVSYFDAAAEGFYHGLTLGFLAILRDRYRVRSNRESGDGRFDIALAPLIPGFPGVILEVKAAAAETDDLDALAKEAREQIDAKGYATALEAEGVTDILKLGVAYRKKRIALAPALGRPVR